ncbi:MAG TPA: uroporphyrinogen-III C-methyltransferase [Armatimonadetes bacterium]|nr:uroporphyrinogen-III C-methyltransferase [Armatimonadota bacterium]
MTPGTVYLVGAGPGEAGLITVKGLRCLRAADVVVYDRLVNPQLLREAKPEAELIYVGKAPDRQAFKQEEINDLLVDLARQGRTVCRLKGGDPFVFGRGGEEAEALAANGVPFEVVPGVTSAVAAPAYAGIPVTHRQWASSLAFITGHEDPTKGPSALRWEQLAGGVDTLVFLMGVGRLPAIVENLLRHGRDPRTPVALVRWGTYPVQETLVGTLGDIVEKAQVANFQPPAVVVVGEVVRLREKLRWFDTKPLFGQRVLVTRARAQASVLAELLREQGAQPIEFPLLRIVPLDFQARLEELLAAGFPFDWVLFTSANGVTVFLEALRKLGCDARVFGGVKIGTIGPATKEALAPWGLKADYCPRTFVAEQLAAEFPEPPQGLRILLPRAREAREVLPRTLAERGARVEVLPVYQTVREEGNVPAIQEQFQRGEIEVVTFTSSSSVRYFRELLGEVPLAGVTIACLGPQTAETARQLGLSVDVVAEEYTVPGLVRALVQHVQRGKEHG